MSIVSGVTLFCGLSEDEDEDGLNLLARLNSALYRIQERKISGFKELSEYYGGNKHPQFLAFGAGINFLDEDAFVEEIMSWDWHWPEFVVLVIKPEDGATRVFRPKSYVAY